MIRHRVLHAHGVIPSEQFPSNFGLGDFFINQEMRRVQNEPSSVTSNKLFD